MAAAGAALTCIGTGGELSREHLQRISQPAQLHLLADVAVGDQVRSTSEDLSRIRKVFGLAVSDLAMVIGVSRQSVYNWLNGEPIAVENAEKLRDLAQAADVFAFEGVIVNPTLLKRKFANGRTLMQVAQSGESVRAAAVVLIQIHKREAVQRERINTRFARRANSLASADFDLPASNDPS